MRTRLRTLAILLLTAGLLTLFFRGVDGAEVWREMRRARLSLVGAAVLATVAVYLLRALRWQYLLQPLGHARFGVAFRTTVIGFAASTLLPARAGEVIRPWLLARREGFSPTAAFATIVLERLLDLLTVALLFGVFLLASPPSETGDPRLFRAVRVGALGAAALSAAALVAMFALARDPVRLGEAAARWGGRLPGRAGALLARLVQRFAEGVHVVRRPRALAIALALSLPLWMAIAAGIWLTSLAFDVTLPFSGSFLVMSLLVVGVAVPTPGAVGGFHAAYRVAATQFYGASDERAVGAGLVLHAVSFVPVTVAGMAFMAQEGLTLAGLRRAVGGAG
ncbi:MAG TPA: lysylphosphatidylglycerol synthase transmembrane domain-containing protein [Vicinamibacterales bacterium]|nr:lysylphosphatidylglycerol synthase transmembrane domain-containing protein [Vicinamibacterales bacterium]